MLLQLANATVDPTACTVRDSKSGDYLTKFPAVVAPDHVLGGGVDIEPTEACVTRGRVYNFTWPICFRGRGGEGGLRFFFHDRYADLGHRDLSDLHFPYLLARMLGGRPAKRVFYFPAPRARYPNRPFEITLSPILGTYESKRQHSTLKNDRMSDEANREVSLRRRPARLLFGQEVDRTTPWRNAMYKRRADCGREGGT